MNNMKTKIAGYDPATKTKTFTPHLNRVDAQDNKEQEQREILDGVFRLLGRFGLILIALAAIYGTVKYFDVSIDLVEIVKWF